MRKSGYYPIPRHIEDTPIWRNPSMLRAWIWLRLHASWRDEEILFNGRRVSLKRGQLVASTRYLAREWGVDKDTVSRYLRAETMGTVVGTGTGTVVGTPPQTQHTIITICDYDMLCDPQMGGGDSDGDTPCGGDASEMGTASNNVVEVKKLRSTTPAPYEKPQEPQPQTEPTASTNTDASPEAAVQHEAMPAKPVKAKVTWDGENFDVPDWLMARFKVTYPEVDHREEIGKAALWLATRPEKRYKNHAAFLNNWLRKCPAKHDPFFDGYDWTEEQATRFAIEAGKASDARGIDTSGWTYRRADA